ncbi:5-dehydro-2-deoxygluconokinase [Frankliniella fusca]|uniref:5-dehydro-2-deoxygluconokinase n=1 Tax=Frankliniella fusca TaxID=407009 RepID=A0AAE1L4J2_9NEOP|nr:5-dehydro-2-deoxygluconokinase [Frankliniella fusca]
MTGITFPEFNVLMGFLSEYVAWRLKYKYDGNTPQKDLESDLTVDNRLLLTLIRLRGGWDEADLAIFFKISISTVSSVFNTWVQFMYFQFKTIQSAMFVKKDLQKKKDRPLPFKPFNNYRVCLDTTEVEIERPTNYEMQGNTYSDYKGGNVILYMIGISCWGGISFISPGFEGSKTDVQIFKESGILDYLEEDGLLLVDRGFPIEEECDEINVVVLHPPFLGPRDKFTPEEEQLTRDIAHARIYVEHAI